MTIVLAVAAHPDDEVLGCGGTLARHAAEGDDVHVLILAEGAAARGASGNAEIEALGDAAIAAAQALGVHPPRLLGLPDNRLDSLDLLDVVRMVEEIVADVSPGVVYTHHQADLNVDHQIAFRAALTACRPQPPSPVRDIYTFETPSNTEWAPPDASDAFVPRRFVDISATLERKMAALACYETEMRPFPHARSIEAVEALARWRGATVGVPAAEAFDVVRQRVVG